MIDPGFFLTDTATYVCAILPNFCDTMAEGMSPFDSAVDNLDRLDVYDSHNPCGAGWRNMVHYAQIIKSKSFRRYDYGEDKNQELYD